MKTVMKTTIRMPTRYAILLGLTLFGGVMLYLFLGTDNPKISTLVGGVTGGIIVYVISFLISIYEYQSIDKFRELGVREILPNRRETEYYRKIVGQGSEIVVVTGTSCSRFIDDFANGENDSHVLIDALRNNVGMKAKFMVPSEEYMDELSKIKFNSGEKKLQELFCDFPNRVELRRFDHEPRYSFVRVDSELIVGPVFAETESQNSPAIHLDVNSSFAEKYLNDFNRVWDNSTPFKCKSM